MNFQRSLKILVFLIVSHGTVQAQDQYLAHKVQRGETLSSIARRHGVSANALIQHNGISNPDNLRIGQNLSIPGKAAQKSRAQTSQAQRRSGATMANRSSGTGSHKLKSGETLSKIARIHGVSVENLQAWNGITDPTKLKVGQEIRIGSGSGGGAKQPSGQKQNFPPTKSARLESGANGVRSHVMKRGETLSSVSRQYGTTIARSVSKGNKKAATSLSKGSETMR